MRKYQVEGIKKWINDINMTGNGIIKAPTGKIFLEFCEYFDGYPEKIKEAVRSW